MDSYSYYNHIRINPFDMENMTFITKKRKFLILVMLFELKNARATY